MAVNITTPTLDEIKASFQPFIEAAQEVAQDAPRIIKDKAILDNEDVDGAQMPPKIPRPMNKPTNFPNLPLIQDDDPDLMDNNRWAVENTEDGAVLIFHPPIHNDYLLDKPQVVGGGGRHWIGRDGKINPTARAEIEQMIGDKIKDLTT